MALCAHLGCLKLVTFMVLLLVVFPVPISSLKHAERPKALTFYLHEFRGFLPNDTMVPVVVSPLGFFAVVNQRLTDEFVPTSKHVGQEIGYISQLGFTAQALYGAFDVHYQTDKYNGTFLMQGGFDLQLPVRTLAVVGGTGDFHLARGSAIFTTAATNHVAGDIVTYKYVVNFRY